MKYLLVWLFSACLLWGSVVSADTTDIISASDVSLYKRIFSAQEKSDFKTADTLIKKLQDTQLQGYVLYQRYFSPHYKTKQKDIETGLNAYGDLPVAHDIYVLGQ